MKKIIFFLVIILLCSCETTKENNSFTENTGTQTEHITSQIEPKYTGTYHLVEFYVNEVKSEFNYTLNYITIHENSSFYLKNESSGKVLEFEGFVKIMNPKIYFISMFNGHEVEEEYLFVDGKIVFENNIGDKLIKLVYEKGE